MGHHNSYDKESVQAPGSKWTALIIGFLVFGLGLTAAGVTMTDKTHASFSYLTSFMFYLSISLGALFFVLIQHLVRAGWSTVVRRLAEGLMKNFLLLAILFIPIAFNIDTLYAWTAQGDAHGAAHHAAAPAVEAQAAHGDHDGHEHAADAKDAHATDSHAPAVHAEGDAGYGKVNLFKIRPTGDEAKDAENETKWKEHLKHVLHHKSAYLYPKGFYIRAEIYFLVWIGLALYLFRGSKSLDTEENKETQAATIIKMGRASAPGLMLFALTATFAAFDWIMATDYGWFSTIFGVIYFSGGVVAVFSTMILAAAFLQSKGYLKGVITIEHYHDFGKFLWGFVVFWTYVSFSQLILIWYADLPEETIWFHTRWNETDGWRALSWVVIIGHFVLPFFLLLSRHIKRNKFTLSVMAVWMLVVSWLHLYWEIMPNMQYPGTVPFNFQIADVLVFLGLGGIYFAFFFLNLKNSKLIPENDPRLNEALNFHNY